MVGSKGTVELGPGCYSWPTLVFRELRYVLEFEHKHERADRYKCINVNFDNVPQYRS